MAITHCFDSEEFLRRAEAAQCLQSRRRLYDRGLVADPGGFDPVSDVRSAGVGDEGFRRGAGSRFPDRADFFVGL